MSRKSSLNKEPAAIEALRERIKDIYDELDDFHRTDSTLLRFLKARSMNVEKAEDMLRKNMTWRKEKRIDEIMAWPLSEELVNRFPFQLPGYDDEGCYISIVPIGKYDYRKIIDGNQKDEFMKYVLKTTELSYELFKYKSAKENKSISQAILIFDYDGFNFRQLASTETMQYMKEIMVEMNANYPEVMKCGIVINAPKLFEVLYTLMKPLLTQDMLDKIQIFGPNQASWKEALWKILPADQLPSHYGGANTTCPDYKFSMGLDLSQTLVTLPDTSMISVVVPAGQKYEVSIPVSAEDVASGCQLCWNFKSEHYDIGFECCFESELQVLVPHVKCDSHVHLQKGLITCSKAGKYILYFDNTYSKFRSKSLQYVTKIIRN